MGPRPLRWLSGEAVLAKTPTNSWRDSVIGKGRSFVLRSLEQFFDALPILPALSSSGSWEVLGGL